MTGRVIKIKYSVKRHTCKPFHVTQSQIDHHWPMRTAGISSDRQHFERHSCASESSDTVSWISLNRTKASFCRKLIPANCHLSDVLPCPKSICYLWLVSWSVLVSLNHRCECSFVSVGIKNTIKFKSFISRRQSGWIPTATNRHGLTGWNRTYWTRPLLFENGICVRRFDNWWISVLRFAPSGITVAK